MSLMGMDSSTNLSRTASAASRYNIKLTYRKLF